MGDKMSDVNNGFVGKYRVDNTIIESYFKNAKS